MLFNHTFTRKMNKICTNPIKEDPPAMSDYRVMVETTPNKTRAQKQLNTLKSNQITCRIATLNLDNKTYYSVQAGPFSQRKEALTQLDRIKKLGVRHAFITRSTSNT